MDTLRLRGGVMDYRVLEFHRQDKWEPYGVGYYDDRGRILLFVPMWRTQRVLYNYRAPLEELNEEQFPNTQEIYRWRDVEHADAQNVSPSELMSLQAN